MVVSDLPLFIVIVMVVDHHWLMYNSLRHAFAIPAPLLAWATGPFHQLHKNTVHLADAREK